MEAPVEVEEGEEDGLIEGLFLAGVFRGDVELSEAFLDAVAAAMVAMAADTAAASSTPMGSASEEEGPACNDDDLT